jgi:hypothetical protein
MGLKSMNYRVDHAAFAVLKPFENCPFNVEPVATEDSFDMPSQYFEKVE